MNEVKNKPESLSIVAVSRSGSETAAETEIQEAGAWEAIRGVFVGRKEVPLDKINGELDRVQAELDDVLSKIDTQSRHGFQLSEVTIALGISAEGSIGVVSAGVEAGITLKFSR